MTANLSPIYIPQLLKLPKQTDVIPVHQYLDDLETLMPIQGELRVTHQGNYLQVSASVETIVTLTCDRCLQQYNYRLPVQVSEMIWLRDEPIETTSNLLEQEVALDDLVETLSPQGYFHPDTWLYEQICLSLPFRRLCDETCPGILVSNSSDSSPNHTADHRWSSLEKFRQQLIDNENSM
jgi:uncharacterized protein